MKNLKLIIGIFVFALLFCSGAQAQKTKLVSGDLSFLKDITELNIEYDFSDFGVGKYKKEADYIERKRNDYNEDEPGRGDKWVEDWNGDKEIVFMPKFEELLNDQLEDEDIHLKSGDYPDAEYTLTLKTTFMEPGYNVGVSRKNAYINVEIIFSKTADMSTSVAHMTMDKVPGRGAFGNDYDTAYRIGEAYAKCGKSLAAYLIKKVY